MKRLIRDSPEIPGCCCCWWWWWWWGGGMCVSVTVMVWGCVCVWEGLPWNTYRGQNDFSLHPPSNNSLGTLRCAAAWVWVITCQSIWALRLAWSSYGIACLPFLCSFLKEKKKKTKKKSHKKSYTRSIWHISTRASQDGWRQITEGSADMLWLMDWPVDVRVIECELKFFFFSFPLSHSLTIYRAFVQHSQESETLRKKKPLVFL